MIMIICQESNSINYRALFSPVRTFKICHDTRYGMDKFFSLKSKTKFYGNKQNKINQDSMKLGEFCSKFRKGVSKISEA